MLIKDIIFRLFGVKPKTNDDEYEKNKSDVEKYKDIKKVNFTNIFSNALSNYAFGDSSIAIVSENDTEPTQRVKLLNDIIQKFWKQIKRNIAIGNGCGMIASVPYVSNGKLYIDTVSKDKFFITGLQGDEITQCIVLAETRVIDSNIYKRWIEYALEDGAYHIRQRTTLNDNPCELSCLDEWVDISPEITISGVERLPIGIYKCPTSSRSPDNIHGVPITYGCDDTIEKINTAIRDLESEFKEKQVRIFAPSNLFNKNKELSKTYVMVNPSGKLDSANSIDVFDPQFRETAYFSKIERLFAQLEKEVGTSRGILTDLSVQGATATEIKRAMLSTFNLCDDIRVNAISYIENLVYGLDVLCNAFNLAPPSEYNISYSWSYSMLEDSETTFNQLTQGKSLGAVSTAELRNFIYSSETLEESREAVKKIQEEEPALSTLLGE